jgi:hypothetical protein
MRRIGSVVIGGEGYNVAAIAEKWPLVSRSVLFQIGLRAAKQLYRQELQGILRPRSFSGSGFPISPEGTRMVKFSVSRDNKSLVLRSFPMNVYRAKGEKGPRSAKRTAGKRIFRSFEGGFDAPGAAAAAIENVLRNSKLFQPEPGAGRGAGLK